MSWIAFLKRCGNGLFLAGAVLAAGCSSFRSTPPPPPEVVLPPATPEQQAWFEANRENAHYQAGRGWTVDGADGFYDDQGRKLPPRPDNAAPIRSSDDTDTSVWKSLAPKSLNMSFKKLIGRGPNEAVARAAYAEGEALFREKRYLEAAKKFHVAYDRGPDLPIEEDAMFKAGESYFFADRYSNADDSYGLAVKKYPNSQYLDRIVARRFATARYWELCDVAHHHWALTPNLTDKTRPRFDTRGHALRVYDRVRLEDPTGPLADDSIMASANLHFRLAHWEDAAYFYDLLRKDYPKSEHQYNAHLLGLESKLRIYQGPQYDIKPLEDADELAAQLLAQFPRELGDEKDRIVETRAKIRAAKAGREFAVASYYFRGKYYGAARIYYNDVINAYPDTKLAIEAQARIDEVKDKPANPKKYFAWIDTLIQPASYVIGSAGSATSGLPTGMGQAPTGIGTLGGMGGGLPATPSGS